MSHIFSTTHFLPCTRTATHLVLSFNPSNACKLWLRKFFIRNLQLMLFLKKQDLFIGAQNP